MLELYLKSKSIYILTLTSLYIIFDLGRFETEASDCSDSSCSSGRDSEFLDHERNDQLPHQRLAGGERAQRQVHFQGKFEVLFNVFLTKHF